MHASEEPRSREDTFAFTAAGSKETHQDLIENTYLTVLLTAGFFSFLISRSQTLDTGCGIFFIIIFDWFFFPLFGCELKANNS